MCCITDYVAAGSFADIKENVTYLNQDGYAQLVRTVDLKKDFTNNDMIYVDQNAFDYLWRVNLNEECIVMPNIGANIGEVYYVEPSKLPQKRNVLGPNAILLNTNENKYFIFTLLNSKMFQKKLFENVGSSGQPKFNKTELKSISLLTTSIDEQNKIGMYFRQLDNLITLHQRKYEKLQNIKKSMLEKMFPKNGMKVPEIRFEGFTDDWEQRKLQDMARFSKGSGYSKSDLQDQGTPIILYGRLYTKYEFAISEIDTFVDSKEGSIFSNGGEVIIPASGETAEDIARAATVENAGVILGGDLNIVHPNEELVSQFLSLIISNGSVQKELASKAQGKSVVHIHNSDIEKLVIYFPNIEEQNKIVSVFKNLDNLITLHQRKLEKLQNIKKSCLEKMFV